MQVIFAYADVHIKKVESSSAERLYRIMGRLCKYPGYVGALSKENGELFVYPNHSHGYTDQDVQIYIARALEMNRVLPGV